MAVSAEMSHNFSCLRDVGQLQCHQQPGPGNVSRLVCSSDGGDGRAALLHTVLVSLTALIVPLAIVFNLAVILTVLLNRKLHTVINVLVTVLGINNLAWTGMPVVLTMQARIVLPILCSVRTGIFIITRGVNFTVIVTITVLRYLMVVRNRNYPASAQNVVLFVSVAVLPAILKWIIRRSHRVSACNPVVAQNPDGFLIVAKFVSTFDLLTGIIAIVEYGGGIFVLAFCYTRILTTTFRARQRVQRNPEPSKITAGASQDERLARPRQKSSWNICKPSGSSPSDENYQDRVNSSQPIPGPSCPTRPTLSGGMPSMSPAESSDRQKDLRTFHCDSRNIQSDCNTLSRVEVVTSC